VLTNSKHAIPDCINSRERSSSSSSSHAIQRSQSSYFTLHRHGHGHTSSGLCIYVPSVEPCPYLFTSSLLLPSETTNESTPNPNRNRMIKKGARETSLRISRHHTSDLVFPLRKFHLHGARRVRTERLAGYGNRGILADGIAQSPAWIFFKCFFGIGYIARAYHSHLSFPVMLFSYHCEARGSPTYARAWMDLWAPHGMPSAFFLCNLL